MPASYESQPNRRPVIRSSVSTPAAQRLAAGGVSEWFQPG
jgi:hypothetical protein